jgi:cytochrome c oxidase subunit 1
MHILGLQGMSRRIDHYSPGFGFEFWNMVVSIGAFVIALSVAAFLVNVVLSTVRYKRGLIPRSGPDPWDARSLEWMTASPVPEHNFDEEIEVHGLDEFWHRKYGYDKDHKVVRIATAEEVAQKGDNKNVHLPSPSYWPLVLAAGMPLVGYGLIFSLWWAIPGVVLVIAGVYGWVMEPSTDPDAGHHHDDHDAHDDDPESAAAELTEGAADDADATADDAATDDAAVSADAVTTEEAPVG